MSDGRPKLLIIDDGDRYAELAHALLRDYDYATRCELPGPCWRCPHREGCQLTHAHDWVQTEHALAKHSDIDVVLLDVAFDIADERLLPVQDDGGDLERRRRLQGLAILQRLRRTRAELPVILMTSREELALEQAAGVLEADELVTLAGADAFDARALGLLIERVLAHRRELTEAGAYLWGDSAAMARLRRDGLALARTSLPVLVLGETGTGKSLLAEGVLHRASGRGGPFVSADLSALPDTLLAAELFGTVRGAFSGAVDRPGLFERAHGGTLLLDEIGNLPADVQRMLLLVLQERRVTRLGATRATPVDVKLVAATNSDLEAAVRAGRFRTDLYARLNPAARLVLPPLRERPGDIEPLLQGLVRRAFAAGSDRTLLGRYLEAAGVADAPQATLAVGHTPQPPPAGVTFVLSQASFRALRAHPWPGNVRELESLVHNATLFALGDALQAAEQDRGATSTAARTIPIPARLVRELLAGSWVQGERAPLDGPSTATAPSGSDSVSLRVQPGPSARDVARELERQLYERLFHETGGDFVAMARRLIEGDPETNARRVRLRFNQLGLRARRLRAAGKIYES